MPIDNEKKQSLALLTGFGLIIFVIIFTLLRDKTFFNSDDSTISKDSSTTPKKLLPTYKSIGATDLNKKTTLPGEKDGIVMLDVRPFEAFAQEHILSAINVPLDEFPVAGKIDTRKLIIIIGASSTDDNIEKAITKLKDEKIENILVLAGGMESWKQLVGASVTYGDPKSFVDQAKVSYLDAENLNDALKQQVPVYILDVRSNDDYKKGHIAGAINIPFDELEKRRSEIKEKKIVVVGINELQEFQASVQLYDMLLASPFVMRGAMPKWQELKLPMVQ